MKIITTFIHPPIPIRCMDWIAYEADYDPGEPDENGTYYGGSPVGHGATKAEAIADLMIELEMRG